MPIVQQLAETAERFERRFARPPTVAAAAPGRANLLGDHTDYNDGFVLPLAIERQTLIVAAPRGDRRANIVSTAFDGEASFEVSAELAPGEPGWSNYIRGVVKGCLDHGLDSGGFDALVDSTVPAGGGLSSSASLEVAAATLVEALSENQLAPVDKALLCQRAEHEFAGTPCGIMDQFISVMGRAGTALLIDCRSHQTQPVPLDDASVEVLIVNSNVRRALVDGEYAARRAQCEAAAAALGVAALRDATMPLLESTRDRLDDAAFRRARHVIRENQRVVDGVAAMRRRDWPSVGALLYDAHESLRDDFEVSCAELDVLVDLAAAIGPDGGMIGSRMCGGGFGGCTVSLVYADHANTVREAICAGYRERTGIESAAFSTRAAAGARMLTLGP